MNPQLTAAERDAFAESQAEFVVDLYRAVLADPNGPKNDLFLSPVSISTALAMTYAGAHGETAAAMRKVLRYVLPDDRVHAAFNALDLALESRGKGAQGADGQPFRLRVANSVWAPKDLTLDAQYLDTLAVNYGAGLNLLDFAREPEPSRLAINAWVEEQTERRIKELLPKDSIKSNTALVLTNAVYFNAAWAKPFAAGLTKPEPFTRLDGTTTQAQMMTTAGSFPYARGEGYEAVEIPYQGNELSMFVIAPDAGTFASFESSLTGAKILDTFAGLESREVILHFPKLELEGDSLSLREALQSLGMKRAFEGGDFSGIAPADLSIDDVLHKTFLKIDEEGTEAAAATAVVVEVAAAPVDPPQPVEMKVDRPFFTAIVDRETKALVFFGRIVDPKVK